MSLQARRELSLPSIDAVFREARRSANLAATHSSDYPTGPEPSETVAPVRGEIFTVAERARGADHRSQIGVAAVLPTVSLVDPVVERAVDWREYDVLGHARCGDPSRLLPQRGLVPARVLAIVGANEKLAVDRDGPDPGRRAVGDTIITQGSDVKIVGLGDLHQLIPLPRRAH